MRVVIVYMAASLALACTAPATEIDPELEPDGPPTTSPKRDARAPQSTTGRDGGVVTGADARAGDGRPRARGDDAGTVVAPATPVVAISELMYHPVLENALVENHEFVELHNPGTRAVSLAGWKLAGLVTYTFPASASIGPGEYLVIAKNRARLATVAKYALDAAKLLGDYGGELDNGGGVVSLLDAGGTVVDAVKYDDKFPWPVGADALGAGESWLPAEIRPLSQHRYMGRSLERVSYAVAASEVANWAPSPLDGATPGKRNASAAAVPPAIVLARVAARESGTGLIRAADRVAIDVRLSKGGPANDVQLEYFIDNPETTDEKPVSTPMMVVADGHRTVLPPAPDNSVVRYRITANRGTGREILSPRPSDPYRWHAYFVSPANTGTSRVYHLFVSRANWTQLWRNLSGGPNTGTGGCTENLNWQKRVPAVFVYDGVVYDVQLRYQGSRFNRTTGVSFSSWPHPGPSAPSPLRALSWSLKLPRYGRFDGHSELTLNKARHGCPYFAAYTASQLMEAAGLPSPRIRWARVYVNGGYYKYMAEVEPLEERFIERRTNAVAGDMWKASGANGDQGPWGRGNASIITDRCGFPASKRYEYTYNRQTHSWKTGDEPRQLIMALHAARAAGTTRLREFLAAEFDVEKTLTYLAVKNWMAPWDDPDHNWVLYRPLGGKWQLLPWDQDLDLGVFHEFHQSPVTASLFAGAEGDPNNKLGPNYLKDSFFKAYRTEYLARVKQLTGTILNAASLTRLLAGSNMLFNRADWDASPIKGCNPTDSYAFLEKWVRDRQAVVATQLP